MSDIVELSQSELNDYADAMQQELTEYLPEGSKYFRCGYRPAQMEQSCYYNFNYFVALSLIGRFYMSDRKKMSDYKKGILVLAQNLTLSHREVKALRKKFKCGLKRKAYVFVTPYTCGKIINEIVRLLEDKKEQPAVQKFLSENEGMLYRTVLIGNQYDAVKDAVVSDQNNPHVRTRGSKKKSKKVEATYTELSHITK